MAPRVVAVPFAEHDYAEVDVEAGRLSILRAGAVPSRPADAVFQRYGRTWIAMARNEDDGLVLVTQAFVVALPVDPAPERVRWRRRRRLWGELVVASPGAAVRFRYRLPFAMLLNEDAVGIEDDLAYWIYWRLHHSEGLRDWLSNPDWRLGTTLTACGLEAP